MDSTAVGGSACGIASPLLPLMLEVVPSFDDIMDATIMCSSPYNILSVGTWRTSSLELPINSFPVPSIILFHEISHRSAIPFGALDTEQLPCNVFLIFGKGPNIRMTSVVVIQNRLLSLLLLFLSPFAFVLGRLTDINTSCNRANGTLCNPVPNADIVSSDPTHKSR